MKKILILILLLYAVTADTKAQTLYSVKGKVFDENTREPLSGVTINLIPQSIKTISAENGSFILNSSSEFPELLFSYVGYETRTITITENKQLTISLKPKTEGLETVVITANREAGLRTEAPIAISKITSLQINDAKPNLLVELINKVPGVVMLNYNNEQHGMGIRQPFGTSPYFLYLEDGIPLRPLGIFNHNALIETNIFSLSSVEVIKGPASSMYGAEAVGGTINFITRKPTAIPSARIGLQADNYGYKRLQWGAGGYINKKLGVSVGGFAAEQSNSWQTRSDYNKFSLNARADYHLSARTDLSGSFSINNYYSETAGSVDSTAFYKRQYSSNNNFTYRSVDASKASIKLIQKWNIHSRTESALYFRKNAVGQNPQYSIRWTPGSSTASGEINENTFNSFGIISQHSKDIDFLNAHLLAGISFDRSPNKNRAYKTELNASLRPDKRSVETYTLIRELPEDFLTNYRANIYNSAAFAQLDFKTLQIIKVSLGGRFDRMAFTYQNFLDQTSGKRSYAQFTPKIGLTADLGRDRGLYANLSKGFSPPGLSAIFRKNTTAKTGSDLFYYNLKPAVFNNMEIGGWAALIKNTIYLDWAFYRMNGSNELLNIRMPDGSTDYQSAGKTLHKGIEYSLTYKPDNQWLFRFGGSNAVHRFVEFTLSNRQTDVLKNVNGYDMPQAPKWVANTEVTYKPAFAKGLRMGIEWQAISSWYQNQINTVKYEDRGAFGFKGVSVLNFRTAYQWRGIEVFANLMNLSNELYASSATRGNNLTDRTTFTPSAPRYLTTGLQYNFNGEK